VEYDAFQYVHQVPGGMISNLQFMLAQRKMEHRLGEVLEEISVIRQEWGYPVMINTLLPARWHPGGIKRIDGRKIQNGYG